MRTLDHVISATVISLLLTNLSYSQWVRAANESDEYKSVYSLATIDSTIFAGTYGWQPDVFRSTDNGENWTRAGLTDIYSWGSIYSITRRDSSVFAWRTLCWYGCATSLFVSEDQAETWTQIVVWSGGATHCLVANDSIMLAGFVSTYWYYPDGGGVNRSTDQGSTWTNTLYVDNSYGIRSLVMRDSIVYAGGAGVFVSSDLGITWTQTPMEASDVNDLAVNTSNVFAGTADSGVYVSSDDGATWRQTPLDNQDVTCLAVTGSNIFAGTVNRGVFHSSDNGLSWTQRNEGIGNSTIRSLALTNDHIFAGTEGDWVWRRPLADFIPTGVDASGTVPPGESRLLQNYPNPFNPTTTIRYTIPSREWVEMYVIDVLGRKIETLVNAVKEAGSHEVTWDARGFASGVYIYRIRAGSYSETRTMVLAR